MNFTLEINKLLTAGKIKTNSGWWKDGSRETFEFYFLFFFTFLGKNTAGCLYTGVICMMVHIYSISL